MYTQAIRCYFNASLKLGGRKGLMTVTLISPTLVLARQPIVPHRGFYVSAHRATEERLHMPKDPRERRETINADAQRKIDAMIQQNPELEKFREIVKLEIELLRQNGEKVPSELTPVHWLDILVTKSRIKRERYYEFLFKLEKKEENRKKKQEESNVLFEISKQSRDKVGVRTDVMVYGIGRNSLFRRISEATMNQLWKWNGLKSTIWGTKIVFDLSYEQYMRPQEIRSCARQIMESYAANKVHDFPFDVYLCNADVKGPLMTNVIKFIPSLFDDDFPWTVTPKSFTQIFDKDSMVYLTEHSNVTLQKYDTKTTYIIGAFVDKSYKQPVSLAKAKELGIRTAKLPLDRHLHFGDGSHKILTVNQIMSIMLDAQAYGWEKALEHVPKRKLFESRLKSMERKLERDMQKAEVLRSPPALDFSYEARGKLRDRFIREKLEYSSKT
ncbi:mitochondrial ribonuclease P protein 1 homolog [Copidosoma floridanum]|uniref:mitochondrial ribonuclease P protein 1 homolog n=1 Tax=Copidosoma floridanum TaxID=29053 RepID=UPI0006C9603A|nr:mitochondrial ribonuclease P protein 1 homolog [Copidosoma floridanum]XP_014214065.1 mitochondrial ribonuclease P protein 1 homolog [Copidosoma floridanum]XP_014214066.1 mitochondrial ribonuclease P protein 1 homolog [Copidosoma floridanum]XP_014214068.1 mitochondrial ribonuclease P protein 1 homolog [Copidosoma floridanum]